MERHEVYNVSGSSNDNRTYLLRDASNVLSFTDRGWGQSFGATWPAPDLIAYDEAALDTDFSTFYLPGLLIATRAACDAIAFDELERLPVRIGRDERYLLNPHIMITRLRKEAADLWELPSGAILNIIKADFYSADVPVQPRIFWFHDGNFPRFLLCNGAFRSLVQDAKLTGLTFKLLGYARPL